MSSVDAWCFERDLDSGRRALRDSDPAAARPLLAQALSWWRGEAYVDDQLVAEAELLATVVDRRPQ